MEKSTVLGYKHRRRTRGCSRCTCTPTFTQSPKFYIIKCCIGENSPKFSGNAPALFRALRRQWKLKKLGGFISKKAFFTFIANTLPSKYSLFVYCFINDMTSHASSFDGPTISWVYFPNDWLVLEEKQLLFHGKVSLKVN